VKLSPSPLGVTGGQERSSGMGAYSTYGIYPQHDKKPIEKIKGSSKPLGGLGACAGPAKAAEHLLLSAFFGYFLGKQKVTERNLQLRRPTAYELLNGLLTWLTCCCQFKKLYEQQ
jgi:hypothetical protein